LVSSFSFVAVVNFTFVVIRPSFLLTFTTFIVLDSSGTLALRPGLAECPDLYGALKIGIAQLQCGG
jgi:hypothetical protein